MYYRFLGFAKLCCLGLGQCEVFMQTILQVYHFPNFSPICPDSMFSVKMYIIYIKSPFLVVELSKSKIFNGNNTTFIPSPCNFILRSYLRLFLYHAVTKYSSMSMHYPNAIYMSLIQYISYVSMHCPIVIYMSPVYFICVHAFSNCDLYEFNILHMCPCSSQL
jgi:hypothetical protein